MDEDREESTESVIDNETNTQYNEVERYSRKVSHGYQWAFDKKLLRPGVKKQGDKPGEYSERKLFFDKIGELNYNKYAFHRLPDGNYLFCINNKIVATDGKNNNPSIEWVVEFNKHSNFTTLAEDYFYEYITNGRTVQEGIEFVNSMLKEKVATLYRNDSSGQNSREGQQEQGAGRYSSNTQRDGRRAGSIEKNTGAIKLPLSDSNGNTLTESQQEYFKNSKVRDENGNLLVMYHGTDAEFSVFDGTKARSTMDIQGSFFSPWEIEAQGYGSNVKPYYLNITNPASESEAYKALKRYQGQNHAGIKARKYLESLGYDGVIGYDECISFNSNQAKLTTNKNPTSNPDIRYSRNETRGGKRSTDMIHL